MNRPQDKGNPSSKFYVISLEPTEDDKRKGFINSGTVGWELQQWGFPPSAFYTYIHEDSAAPADVLELELQVLKKKLEANKPAIIVTLGDAALQILCPELVKNKKKKLKKSALKSTLLYFYSGSLLVSSLGLSWPHYLIPTLSAADVWRDWPERDVVLSIDVARAIEEYEFYQKHRFLKPLPEYKFILQPSCNELIQVLKSYRNPSIKYLSVDIETLRPKKDTEFFKGHPGFVYTIALAPSIKEAVSFCFWKYASDELVLILKELQWLFLNKQIIGQNFMSFDVNFLEAFFGFVFQTEQAAGFLPLVNIHDTKIRHHILHPELPHSLQFMTRQYTRQPFYKLEGKGFSPRSKQKLIEFLSYGAKDTTVTYMVYVGQEEEFQDRRHLI